MPLPSVDVCHNVLPCKALTHRRSILVCAKAVQQHPGLPVKVLTDVMQPKGRPDFEYRPDMLHTRKATHLEPYQPSHTPSSVCHSLIAVKPPLLQLLTWSRPAQLENISWKSCQSALMIASMQHPSVRPPGSSSRQTKQSHFFTVISLLVAKTRVTNPPCIQYTLRATRAWHQNEAPPSV